MGASSAAGRVLFGIFADKIGRLAAFKISVVLSALSVYFWLLCGDNFGMMAAFSVMYGVFGGSVLGLLTVAVAEVLGVVRCEKCFSCKARAYFSNSAHELLTVGLLIHDRPQVGIGHSMCLVYTSISIPYLLSAPVGGWIADATGVYWPSIVLSGHTAKSPHIPFSRPNVASRVSTASSLFLGSLVFLFFLRRLEQPPPAKTNTALAQA